MQIGIDLGANKLEEIYDNEFTITTYDNKEKGIDDVLIIFKIKEKKDIDDVLNLTDRIDQPDKLIKIFRENRLNYLKYKNREVVGLRLFNKFFLFFGLFSVIPSGIILMASAIFFNIEVSTWLGPAFKSTVNNSYQLAQKYIDQTEKDLITDSKFIRNYVLAERLIDRDIIQRFNITTVYNYNNGNQFIEHISDEKIFLSDDNLRDASKNSETDITIFFSNDQLFSRVNLNSKNYLLLLKNIDLETLNYYQNIIQSYEAINSFDNNKRDIQITFFTIYIVLSTSLIFVFIIIGTNFSFRLAKPIRDLNNSIIDLRKGKYQQSNFEKLDNKDDISVLTNSFHEMSKTIISQ